MCIKSLQRRRPVLLSAGLPSASAPQQPARSGTVAVTVAVTVSGGPCHGALRCVAWTWLSGLGRFASQGAVQYHRPILLQPLLTSLRPLHHRLHRPTHPNAAARSSPAFARKATPGWPTSLLSCLRSLSPPSRLRSCRSSRTASAHETAPHYT